VRTAGVAIGLSGVMKRSRQPAPSGCGGRHLNSRALAPVPSHRFQGQKQVSLSLNPPAPTTSGLVCRVGRGWQHLRGRPSTASDAAYRAADSRRAAGSDVVDSLTKEPLLDAKPRQGPEAASALGCRPASSIKRLMLRRRR
jgi:hypothetical protein